MILSCSNISKAFGGVPIIRQASFHIEDHEKAAIVGINGAGKSTLLKIIIGELAADEGQVIVSKGKTVGYLAQHQELLGNRSIYNELLEVKRPLLELEQKIRKLEQEMKHAPEGELENMLSAYSRLNHEFELQNGYAYESEVTGVLKGLGFQETEFDKPVATLSGGQKTRISLGRLLLTRPDVILLDEPTNHLDMNSIAWLEGYLMNYGGSVLIVAHDRYFLDRIVNKVIELDNGRLTVYRGNYTGYSKKRAMLREAQIKAYVNQQQVIRRQEEVIARLKSFNREKSIRRAESREKMLDKIQLLEKPAQVNDEMNIHLEPSVISGNDVLTVRDLSKSFGSNCLFTHVDFELKRGQRAAIIGGNGTGKTTILKILNGLLPADTGEIRLGSQVRIGYYDQEHQVLHMEKTLFDELQDTYPTMNNTRIRSVLAAFLFTGDDVFKRIGDLSGGERGRVSLAKLMLSEANFLILDEPTNHLDITSREILESALTGYTGTVLYVSHDRYFINRTATRILDLTGGRLLNYIGNYDYYLEKREGLTEQSSKPGPDNAPAGSPHGAGSKDGPMEPSAIKSAGNNLSGEEADRTDPRQNQTAGTGSSKTAKEPGGCRQETSRQDWKSFKEEQARQRKRQNDLKKTEDEIHKLEMRESEIDQLLTLEEVYTNVSRLLKLNSEREELKTKLKKLFELWETLAE